MGLFDIFRKRKKTFCYQIKVNGQPYTAEFDCSKEAIETFEKNKNSAKETPIPPEHERVDINAFFNKYTSVMSVPGGLFRELQRKRIAGFTYADIPIKRLREIESCYKTSIDSDRMIAQIAALNNDGIEYEKAGNIDAAIAAYQQNVSSGAVATHSYERLMIIYRKRQEYDKEIDVIEKAIDVFSKENEHRAEIAIMNCPSKATEIKSALESCTNVLGDTKNQFGAFVVCFAPYDVNKYRNRLEKANLLKAKRSKALN